MTSVVGKVTAEELLAVYRAEVEGRGYRRGLLTAFTLLTEELSGMRQCAYRRGIAHAMDLVWNKMSEEEDREPMHTLPDA